MRMNIYQQVLKEADEDIIYFDATPEQEAEWEEERKKQARWDSWKADIPRLSLTTAEMPRNPNLYSINIAVTGIKQPTITFPDLYMDRMRSWMARGNPAYSTEKNQEIANELSELLTKEYSTLSKEEMQEYINLADYAKYILERTRLVANDEQLDCYFPHDLKTSNLGVIKANNVDKVNAKLKQIEDAYNENNAGVILKVICLYINLMNSKTNKPVFNPADIKIIPWHY